MSDPGWCPFARQHRGWASGPFGYPAGTIDQNRPLAFVDHIMDGYKRTLDNDQWRHDNWVGVHAGIGRDGSIDQYTSIRDASWGNGTCGNVGAYDRANPVLGAIERMGSWIVVNMGSYTTNALVLGNVNVINTHTISTEHEGFPSNPWTPAMVDASLRWKRWCVEELQRLGMSIAPSAQTIIGHMQIDPRDRANCPGPNWPKSAFVNALQEDDEMWVRMNRVAAWFENRELDPDPAGRTMMLGIDFPDMPATVKAVELEVFLDPSSEGNLVYMDGNGAYAGKVGAPWGYRAVIRCVPLNRTLKFRVEGAHVKITRVGLLAYVA